MADMSMAKDMTLEQIATNHPTFVSAIVACSNRRRSGKGVSGRGAAPPVPTETESSMKFGYFDDAQREYVITRPDTPLPWINYLGCEEYFGLISNTAGGYSFYKDARSAPSDALPLQQRPARYGRTLSLSAG